MAALITRRGFAQTLPVAATALTFSIPAFAQSNASSNASSGASWAAQLTTQFRHIERDCKGRLGVFVLDTQRDRSVGYRQGERFPMCSTFKLVLAAAVLKRVDQGKEKLDRPIPVKASDIVPNSPGTEKKVGDSMTLAELCAATTILSDNAAANLILATLGGPKGMTAFARSIGDKVFRLDRIEPMMSNATPHDLRDTTTPQAMAETVQKLVLGDVLSDASRAQLTDWLVGNKTGDTRLRAGVPGDWRVGDKTGAGGHGTTNDVGLFWAPQRKPIIVSVYLTGSRATSDERNATIAAVARAVSIDARV